MCVLRKERMSVDQAYALMRVNELLSLSCFLLKLGMGNSCVFEQLEYWANQI